MAKLYSKNFIKESNDLKPKEETVNFLLNYSKALSVINYNNLEFEALLN
ncbi:MAG: hypothetical protein ABJL44_14440 [Algibacter sp.]